ncbi:glycine--tRNA ligase [bacterium]|nr:glycine--tRNA ligase [bacterium]
MTVNNDFSKIVSLCKRRGFVFPGSEIYGGLANTYDFGPLGVEMLHNVLNSWWDTFVRQRNDMYGLDSSILMSPKVWEASGHTKNFTDVLVDCRECQFRTRADHLIEDFFEKKNEKIMVEGKSLEELDKIIISEKIPCPKCGKNNFTPVRKFNLLFETNVGIVTESQSKVYLRGEIAQGMFVNFKNVLDTMRPKLPFGIAQSGKAFRNEITLGNFIFRTLEFNLSEFEYFFDPNKENIDELFEYWKNEMENYLLSLGLNKEKMRWRVHGEKERAHYSSRTEDLEYEFPFGFKEVLGLAYRTDFDLKNHSEQSGTDLKYFDPETNERITPHVIEPTFGINRIFLALLSDAFEEESDERTLLKLNPKVSPYQLAIFPLVKNKPEIVSKALEVFHFFKKNYRVTFDSRGNIGKRYLSQDEIGTPYCITIDYETLENGSITIRNRDDKTQVRISTSEIKNFFTI